jgi:hypothetical protein
MDADGADRSRSEEDAAAEETRATMNHGRTGRSEPDATGFVWCETDESASESGASPADGGFEWGGAVTEALETGESQSTEDAEPTEYDSDNDGLSLDPTLVTTARGAGIDDEAVSLLAAFRGHARKRKARLRRRRESE